MRPALRLVPPPQPAMPAVAGNVPASPLPVLCRAVMAAVGALLILVGVCAGWLADALVQAGNAAYDAAGGGHG